MIPKVKTRHVKLACESRCSAREGNRGSVTQHDYADTQRVVPPADDGEAVEHLFRCRVCSCVRRWGLDSVEVN